MQIQLYTLSFSKDVDFDYKKTLRLIYTNILYYRLSAFPPRERRVKIKRFHVFDRFYRVGCNVSYLFIFFGCFYWHFTLTVVETNVSIV